LNPTSDQLEPNTAQDAAWAKLLTQIVTMLERPEADKAAEEEEEVEDKAEYSAAYSQLHNAARKDVDPCAAVAVGCPEVPLVAPHYPLTTSAPSLPPHYPFTTPSLSLR